MKPNRLEMLAERILYNAVTLSHPHARRTLSERERHALAENARRDAQTLARRGAK